jgi:hypothetical protein
MAGVNYLACAHGQGLQTKTELINLMSQWDIQQTRLPPPPRPETHTYNTTSHIYLGFQTHCKSGPHKNGIRKSSRKTYDHIMGI